MLVTKSNASHLQITFRVGDIVLVNVKSHDRPSLQARGPLQPYFAGPYRILEQVGTQDFRIELPTIAKQAHMQDVFNAHQLRPYTTERTLLDALNPHPVVPDHEENELSSRSQMMRIIHRFPPVIWRASSGRTSGSVVKP